MPAGNAEWPRSATLPSIDLKPGGFLYWNMDDRSAPIEAAKWDAAIDNSLLNYQRAADLAAKGWKPAGFANETPRWLRNDLWPDEYNRCLKPHVSVIDQIVERLARDQYSNFRQRIVLGIDEQTFNERSKPMGLTKEHNYEDADGDTILVQDVTDLSAKGRGATALLQAGGGGAFVEPTTAIPVALNVLGYDRPKAGAAVQAIVGHSSAGYSGGYIEGDWKRDSLLAEAAARLLAIDAYDQKAAYRKAKEEAAAKREAEHKKRVDAKEFARKKLLDLTIVVGDFGATPDRADALIAAAKDYKAAVAAVGASS